MKGWGYGGRLRALVGLGKAVPVLYGWSCGGATAGDAFDQPLPVSSLGQNRNQTFSPSPLSLTHLTRQWRPPRCLVGRKGDPFFIVDQCTIAISLGGSAFLPSIAPCVSPATHNTWRKTITSRSWQSFAIPLLPAPFPTDHLALDCGNALGIPESY